MAVFCRDVDGKPDRFSPVTPVVAALKKSTTMHLSMIHVLPSYYTNTLQSISADLTISGHKKSITVRCSSVEHSRSDAALSERVT